jgi:hypothetical protein
MVNALCGAGILPTGKVDKVIRYLAFYFAFYPLKKGISNE